MHQWVKGRKLKCVLLYIVSNIVIWMSEEQRLSMYRSTAAESEQLLGLVTRAALPHKEQFYTLWNARYLEVRAEDIRRRQVAGFPLDHPYSPTFHDIEDSKEVESARDESFSSDSYSFVAIVM